MVSVLFADEDRGALDDLRKMCAERCHDWVPTFVRGGAAALARMESAPVDAVVAGGRLVDMDGPAFLRRAKVTKPETVRISLTSAGDPGAAMRSLPVAHQCITKPFEAEVLIQAVDRATDLQALLNSVATRRMLGQVGDLPSLPDNLAALDAALCDEEASLGDVAKIVTRDVAMSAKVLQLVNSSFVGLRSTVRDLRQAVAYLGVETLRSLTITTEVFRVFNPSELLPGDWMERFNEHSLEVAEIAGRLVRTSAAQYEASVAGLLHDVGELVVADRAPSQAVRGPVSGLCRPPLSGRRDRMPGRHVPDRRRLSAFALGHELPGSRGGHPSSRTLGGPATGSRSSPMRSTLPTLSRPPGVLRTGLMRPVRVRQ